MVTKLNGLKVLISEALIDSYINYEESISIKYLLERCDEIKKPNKKYPWCNFFLKKKCKISFYYINYLMFTKS